MALDEERSKSLQEMITPIWLGIRRYWKIALPPAVGIFGIFVVLALRLPPYYSADTLIFMQPQRLASRMIEEPKKEEVSEKLQALIQEILSRPRLRTIVDRFKLYPEYKGVAGAEQALKTLKSSISVVPAETAGGVRLLQTFKISFTHRDPQIVFDVTKALSNLFIEESVFDRRTEIQGAEEFFDSELIGARKKLEETESRIQEFVKTHFGKLPEHLDQAVARLQNSQAQLESNSQLITANLSRRSNLEAEMNEVRRLTGLTPDGESMAFDPKEALAQLEAALVVQKTRYTDQHPEVINTQKKIEALKQQIAQGGGKAGTTRTSPRATGMSAGALLSIRREMNEIDVQIQALKDENERLKKGIEELNKNIQEMPIREQELLKIKRDYAVQQETYQKLKTERDSAGLQASMVRSEKATQLRVVEPPEKPTSPAGPPRLLIMLAGLVVAILVQIAVPIALYLINGAFRSKDEVEHQLGVKVLGVVPPMVTPEALSAERRTSVWSVAISAASFAAACAVILLVVK